jgi:hypothetical protein
LLSRFRHDAGDAAQRLLLFAKSPREAHSLLPQAVAEARSLGAAATIFSLYSVLSSRAPLSFRYKIRTSGATLGALTSATRAATTALDNKYGLLCSWHVLGDKKMREGRVKQHIPIIALLSSFPNASRIIGRIFFFVFSRGFNSLRISS